MRNLTLIALASCCFVACAPEVGTEKWCNKMEDTPKGDWSANDAKAFAQYCLLGNYVDKDD